MIRYSLLMAFISCMCLACSPGQENLHYDVVPYPNELKAQAGRFVLDDRSILVLPAGANDTLVSVARQLSEQIQKASGILLKEETADGKRLPRQAILFRTKADIPDEGYSLTVEKKRIIMEASTPAGFFYAVQTLMQLFPEAVYGKEVAQETEWSIPCVVIHDVPRFPYRGMHLDVSRHFFSVDEVKKYIDILAMHKVNRFHWHLTDDQGWRPEINRYPLLTKTGSVRRQTMILKEWDHYDRTPYGGYYTQDEIRDIVRYASDRFITVIPEIDLPGHMQAALASYPSLGCIGKKYEVSGQWGVRDDVLCVGKESTFAFLEGVLTEIMDLFPSEYIHIGGDECPKIRWQHCPHCQARIRELGLTSDSVHSAEHYLQSYTIARVEKFLNDHGRQIIGWDEILEGGLAPHATVMSWRGFDGGLEAAIQQHNVIMTPNSHCYFDHYQSEDTGNEPFAIGGYTSVEKVYSLEPVPDTLQVSCRKYIIGAQANLWTEYITGNEQLEYMLLPRLAALSEVQWTQPERKDWERFRTSMRHLAKIYDVREYTYAKHLFN